MKAIAIALTLALLAVAALENPEAECSSDTCVQCDDLCLDVAEGAQQ